MASTQDWEPHYYIELLWLFDQLQNRLHYEPVLPWPVLNAITESSAMILYRQSFKYIKVGDTFSYFSIQPEYLGQNLMIVSLLWSVIITK